MSKNQSGAVSLPRLIVAQANGGFGVERVSGMARTVDARDGDEIGGPWCNADPLLHDPLQLTCSRVCVLVTGFFAI